ncbi:MAG: hypothetical protein ACK5Y6_01800 [Pseudomonadota bacterium]|jgi:hypothetical protein
MANEGDSDSGLGADMTEKDGEQAGASSAHSNASSAAGANPRIEVSAQTIARMMGIASATDLQLLEGRLDVLASRVATLMMKVDKVLTNFSTLASVGDIGRLETQLASVKTMVREASEAINAANGAARSTSKENAELQSKKLREGIRST